MNKYFIRGLIAGGAGVACVCKAISDNRKRKNENKEAKKQKQQKDETVINAEVKEEKVNNETK